MSRSRERCREGMIGVVAGWRASWFHAWTLAASVLSFSFLLFCSVLFCFVLFSLFSGKGGGSRAVFDGEEDREDERNSRSRNCL